MTIKAEADNLGSFLATSKAIVDALNHDHDHEHRDQGSKRFAYLFC